MAIVMKQIIIILASNQSVQEIDFYKQPLFVWNKSRSEDTARCVSSGSITMAFYDKQSTSSGIPKETLKCFTYHKMP